MKIKTPNPPSFHCHPSSLDSASTPEAFAAKELELGSGALTATDHGSIAATRIIYDLAKDKGILPITGIEAYHRDDFCSILTDKGIAKNKDGKFKEHYKYGHVTMHFLDFEAYRTCVKILFKAPVEYHGEEGKPLFNWDDLETLGGQNVTGGSGCLISAVNRHFVELDDRDTAIKYYERLRSCFKPGNFYAEISPQVIDRNWVKGYFIEVNDGDKVTKHKFHKDKKLKTNVGEITAEELVNAFARKGNKHKTLHEIKNRTKWEEITPATILSAQLLEDFVKNECTMNCPTGDLQFGANQFIMEMAAKYGDKLVIGDDAHFANIEDKPVQDVRLMAGGGSWRMSVPNYRKNSQELWDYFKNVYGLDFYKFEEMVYNNIYWSQRFKDFEFKTELSLPVKFFPSDSLEYTMQLVKKHGRMNWTDKRYADRLEKEIELFHRNGKIDLLPYLQVNEELCDLYTKNGYLTGPSRGSSAGVLLSYLIGITHIDPIKENLSLERFLTLDRIESGALPDIDQDLSNRKLLLGGYEGEFLEVEMENGDVHKVDKNTLVKTPIGMVSVEQALSEELEILVIAGKSYEDQEA